MKFTNLYKVVAAICIRSFSMYWTSFFETYMRLFTISLVITIALKKGETAIVQAGGATYFCTRS